MTNRLVNAIHWRIAFWHQQFLKIKWEIKRRCDFSKKEKVDRMSVVVVGRNDNYGGDFSRRLQIILDWNLKNLPNAELIYVEWNQIKEKPSDCEWIAKRYPNAKCYIVPHKIHTARCTNDKILMLEYIAKNIGIRKAGNDWILLVNADVYIDPVDFNKKLKLSKKRVYGTYFCNVDWDQKPITADTYKKNIKFTGHPYSDLSGVVGNFILTHKENWLLSQGYDESLTDVRLGVDNDGVYQLYSKGLKPMIMGYHYHLDHPGSVSKGINPTHGNVQKLLNRKYPYINKKNWGLIDHPLKQITDNIWELQEI